MSPERPTELLLIRHAEPSAWARQRCCGTLDVPLSAEGERQALRLAKRSSETSLAAVYSSPRIRSVATAQPIAARHRTTPRVVEYLAEVDFGELEGLTFEEIAGSHPEVYERWMQDPTSVRFPSGESFAELRERVSGGIARIREEHPSGTVAVVTHAGPIRAMLADALGLPNGAIFRIDLSYGGMTSIGWVDDEPFVRFVNVPG